MNNINFLHVVLLTFKHSYSSEFSIDQSTFETPLLIQFDISFITYVLKPSIIFRQRNKKKKKKKKKKNQAGGSVNIESTALAQSCASLLYYISCSAVHMSSFKASINTFLSHFI